ncbi:uncharacterized [Tachysurus ichikawai]
MDILENLLQEAVKNKRKQKDSQWFGQTALTGGSFRRQDEVQEMSRVCFNVQDESHGLVDEEIRGFRRFWGSGWNTAEALTDQMR